MQRIRKIATLIHPKAVVSPSAIVAEGCIIEAGAVIFTDVRIGKCTIVITNAIVGDCCQLKYSCTIPENCVVPNQTKVNCNIVYKK